MKTNTNTAKVKTKNKTEDSHTCYQTNHRRHRGVVLEELGNTSENTLSDVTRNRPIHQTNVNLPKRRTRKPLIENKEVSVYYIHNPDIPPNPNRDTNNVSILLPNQVDYS